MNTGFLGRDGFIWAIGVVEDRHDPDKMGRVKIRWLGYHTNEQQQIGTDDLPWSQVMQPVGGHTMSGVGESHPGVEEGTWVIGFARDPDSLQDWIVMGTLPGMNTQPSEQGKWGRSRGTNIDYGFFDPTSDFSNIPFQPDSTTFESGASGKTDTPIIDVLSDHASYGPGGYDPTKMYGDEILFAADVASTGARASKMVFTAGSAKSLPNVTHTDALFEAYGTTRRLVGPPARNDMSSFFSAVGDSSYKENVWGGNVVSTGYYEGSDISYPVITDETSKKPYPRFRYCAKGSIKTTYGPSMYDRIEKLYEDGIYGDKKFSDLKTADVIAIPEPDINRLAIGGMGVASVSTSNSKITITTKGGTSYEPFAKDDIITLSGLKGMDELNGRTFTAKSVSGDAKKGYTITIGSSDKTCTGGPGSNNVETYSANNKKNPMADTDTHTYASDFTFGDHIANTGVVILDPHYSIGYRATSREKWINMGIGQFVTGGKDGFRGGVRTRETMTHYWSEPTSAYAAQYPYNHVYESESGHIMEYDDTPGAERIHQRHRSGTYYEINDSGNKTTRVVGDQHNLTIGDDYIYVKGKTLWTGDNEMLIKCNDQMTIGSKWNIRLVSDHNLDIYAKGDLNLRGHKINLDAGENSINMTAGNIEMKATGYASDTDAQADVPFGGLIKMEAGSTGASAGKILLKVPDGNPLGNLGHSDELVDNMELAGGAIVFEGGGTLDLTTTPRSRNTLQARVNFAFKAADAVRSSTNGEYTNLEGDIGDWGPLSDPTIGTWKSMWSSGAATVDNDKPQTNVFAGSTAPAVNKNAENIREGDPVVGSGKYDDGTWEKSE